MRLDSDQAEATAHAPLPEGYGRLGETATRRILTALEADVILYSAAVAGCGWDHSDGRTGEVVEALPYYGEILDRHVIPGTYDENDDDITRYGRITNPTVHIGLNQLRRLVNMIITVYGKPDEIVVELARDLKLSEDQKRVVQRDIKKNTEGAITRGQKLEELGVPNTGAHRMILRLWESLGDDVMIRNCPYTGRRISAGMLFDGSCDINHILPYSRTLDDSFPNRTLCLREANRAKANKTPWEAWGDTPHWGTIASNLKNLPDNQAWRFAPDAMERFEGENDFSARALKDTQYLSRIARSYLEALYDGGDGKSHVWMVPGKLTETLRRHWGLNGIGPLTDCGNRTVKAKNRTDHRHHAIDAAVIAATDHGLIKRISDAHRREETEGLEYEARSTPPPWEGFRAAVAEQISKIIVSHRADHGRIDLRARKAGRDSTAGRLRNDTAYGLAGGGTVVSRKPLTALSPKDIELTTAEQTSAMPICADIWPESPAGWKARRSRPRWRPLPPRPNCPTRPTIPISGSGGYVWRRPCNPAPASRSMTPMASPSRHTRATATNVMKSGGCPTASFGRRSSRLLRRINLQLKRNRTPRRNACCASSSGT